MDSPDLSGGPQNPPPPNHRSFVSLFQKQTQSLPLKIKPVQFKDGKPYLIYDDEEMEKLLAPHRLSLVGKFSFGRPGMAVIRKEFSKFGFHGDFELGLLNERHILLRFKSEQDYQMFWMKSTWSIGGYQLRVLKWMPHFHFEEDPPFASVWVLLEQLPVEYINQESVFSIASAVGTPLQVDKATLFLSRPSVARVCVKVDLRKDLPKSITIGQNGRMIEQFFTYEKVPKYCDNCKKIGHGLTECKRADLLVQISKEGADKEVATPENNGFEAGPSGLSTKEKSLVKIIPNPNLSILSQSLKKQTDNPPNLPPLEDSRNLNTFYKEVKNQSAKQPSENNFAYIRLSSQPQRAETKTVEDKDVMKEKKSDSTSLEGIEAPIDVREIEKNAKEIDSVLEFSNFPETPEEHRLTRLASAPKEMDQLIVDQNQKPRSETLSPVRLERGQQMERQTPQLESKAMEPLDGTEGNQANSDEGNPLDWMEDECSENRLLQLEDQGGFTDDFSAFRHTEEGFTPVMSRRDRRKNQADMTPSQLSVRSKVKPHAWIFKNIS